MATSMHEHNYTSNGGALKEENIHTRNFLFGCEAVHLALESFVNGSWRPILIKPRIENTKCCFEELEGA